MFNASINDHMTLMQLSQCGYASNVTKAMTQTHMSSERENSGTDALIKESE